MNEAVKKYWPWAAGGVVGIIIIMRMSGGNSSSPANSNAATLAAMQAMVAQTNAQNAQISLAQKAEADNMALANAKMQNDAGIAQINAYGNLTQALGSAISTTANAQAQVPIAAMMAASANSQAALKSAAGVAATGLAALPGSLDAAADLAKASYAPIQAYGSALGQMAQGVSQTATNAMNSTAQTAQSAAQAAGAASAANASSTSSTMGAVASVAAIALMFFA